MKSRNNIKGFSLLELLITVMIIGILAAIAYPAYIDHMNKTRRTDGQAALMNLASYMESYFTENHTYVGATLANLGLTATSPQGFYTVGIRSASATAYTVFATPVGAQASDTCGTLSLTNTNVRGPNLECWQ